MTNTSVIEVENLVVDYGRGKKAKRALHGISFKVRQGECVGFIGANGAGKTTTMKALMGFLFPTSGNIRVFGKEAGTAESRQRIGYLPEVALYYPFMKARELLELYGGLSGLSRADLRKKIPPLLEKVGLGGREEDLLKNYSKGMQQRLGIAQSLIAEPDALIFDELSSGLDPLGRHDLREVLLELKEAGRTIFFSSHELSEVEALCDRVLMIHKGQIVTRAPVSDLMKPLNQYEIVFARPGDSVNVPFLNEFSLSEEGGAFSVTLHNLEDYTRLLSDLESAGVKVIKTQSHSQSLEEYFIDLVRESSGEGGDGS